MIRKIWILGLVLSWTFIAVPAYAQAIDPIRGLEVVDSNNKLLGAVSASNGGLTPSVVIELQGTLFEVSVYEDRIVGSFDFLFFTGPDCTGTPYFGSFFFGAAPALYARSAIDGPIDTVYVTNLNDPTQQVEILSQRLPFEDPPNDCLNFPTPSLFDVQEATPLGDLSNFEPPFSLRRTTPGPGPADHSHGYMTGSGVGHNDTPAFTGPPR